LHAFLRDGQDIICQLFLIRMHKAVVVKIDVT
jgi:hypothetical protein